MYFEINVNTARKGSEPNWRPLVDDNDEPIRFETEIEARAVLIDEARGESARIRRYVGGIGNLIP